jgi:hypothetical protein
MLQAVPSSPSVPTETRSSVWLRRALVAPCLILLSCLLPLASGAQAEYSISIGSIDNYSEPYSITLLDKYVTVCVVVDTITGPPLPASAFEFLVCNEQDAMAFVGAGRGVNLPGDWEYFTYRTGSLQDTCGVCPSHSVRLIGIAHLGGTVPDAHSLAGCIAELTYYVGVNTSYVGACEQIAFCALDCGDNSVTSAQGDTVYRPLSGVIAGPDYDSATCADPPGPGISATPNLSFTPGAICLFNPEDRGDVNLNGFPCEVGDAVLFGNYFIYGPSVWDPIWYDSQIFATDFNNDGLTLTIADLYYLIMIIAGHQQPYPTGNPSPPASPVEVRPIREADAIRVQTSAATEIGAIHLAYRYAGGEVGTPVGRLPEGMVMKSSMRNGQLRVAVYPDIANPGGGYAPGEHEILTIPVTGDADLELVEVQLSDAKGNVLVPEIAKAGVPEHFALHQNYPNPFNAATVIPYSLSEDAQVTLEIFDVLGRVVARPVDEFQAAGDYRISWDGADAPSGMYFYRLTIAGHTQTRKMVLLK